MKLRLICIVLLLASNAQAQKDCGIKYAYTGKITSGSFAINGISVPNTRYMSGYDDSDELPSLRFIKVTDSLISEPMIVEMSSDYCKGIESIVKNIFKKKEYLIRIVGKENDHGGKFKMVEMKIPVDMILFIVDKKKKEITIQLPDIRV